MINLFRGLPLFSILFLCGLPLACSQGSATDPDDQDGDAGDADAGCDGDNQADDGGPEDGADPADDDWPVDPAGSGPCSFEIIQGVVASSIDGHDIPVEVFVPGGRPAPYPPVVISHGFQIDSTYYTTTAEHLASWCYLAVLCGYPAGTMPPTPHETIAQDIADTMTWLKNEQHASLDGQVDTELGALVGHSLGGKTSLMASLDDAALADAIIGLDPVDSADSSLLPYRIAELGVPTLLLGETFSGENGIAGQYCAPLDYNYHQIFLHAPESLPCLEVTFLRAQHMSWLDDSDCGLACMACVENEEADHAEVRRLSRRYMTAWLQRFLRQQAGMTSWLWGEGMQADVDSGAVVYDYK